jgi:hypothetical protein
LSKDQPRIDNNGVLGEAISAMEQLERWVAGRSTHRVDEHGVGLCCPDFSCCHPHLLAPPQHRKAFVASGPAARGRMRMAFLTEASRSAASLGRSSDSPTPVLWFDSAGCGPSDLMLRLHDFSPSASELARNPRARRSLGIRIRPNERATAIIHNDTAAKMVDSGFLLLAEQVSDLHAKLGAWLEAGRPSVESEAKNDVMERVLQGKAALANLPPETRQSIADALLYEAARGAAAEVLTQLRSTARVEIGDVEIDRAANRVATKVIDGMSERVDNALAMFNQAHALVMTDDQHGCTCGWSGASKADHSTHVAEVAIRVLYISPRDHEGAPGWLAGIEAAIRKVRYRQGVMPDMQAPAYKAALSEVLVHLEAMLARGTEHATTSIADGG